MKQRLLRLSSLRQAQPSKLNKFPSDDTNNTEQRRPHAESPLFFVGLRSYGCAARNYLLYHFCAKGLTCGVRCAIISFVARRRNGGTGRRPGLKIPWDENPVPVRSRFPAPIRRTLESPFGTYRGVEQLVARRAHNPEVRRFKSPPRNQTRTVYAAVLFFCRVMRPTSGARLDEAARRCRRQMQAGR